MTNPLPDRDTLRAALDASVARLVARAAAEHWPIRADHCFLRVVYDAAVGDKWDSVHARPGWRHLPLEALAAAVDHAAAIERDGIARLAPLNAASLQYRGKRHR